MQLQVITAAALFATTWLAAPANAHTPKITYRIRDFETRKYDGLTPGAALFIIFSTSDNSTVDACITSDPLTGTVTAEFESDRVYPCGKDSEFSFSYDVAITELSLFCKMNTS